MDIGSPFFKIRQCDSDNPGGFSGFHLGFTLVFAVLSIGDGLPSGGNLGGNSFVKNSSNAI